MVATLARGGCTHDMPAMARKIGLSEVHIARMASLLTECADSLRHTQNDVLSGSREQPPCSPPNVLWLQFRGDGDPCDESPIDDADVTWCRDQIFGADEMYIRAEHIMPLLERLSCNTSTAAEVWEWIKALNTENS